MNLILRVCDDAAKPFVADSFVRSYRGGLGPLSEVDAAQRARAMRTWLGQRWGDVRVMTGEGAPDLFLGWVLVDLDAAGWPVWYAYVKEDLRRQGLCRLALEKLGSTHVRLTNHLWQEEWNVRQASKRASRKPAA